ncbi:transposase family protein [Streptomyces sp. NPDC056682]|uniref:transposase family protein n=1 Tax=Streptomyces sp. NPDC056682 TaxID=3345909 RepID=UPI0036AD6563
MPSGLEQLARTHSPQPLPDAVCLARFLAGLPDPHARRGRRFPLIAIVAAAAASVLGGARSLTAVTDWIADAPRWVLLALGFSVDPFSKTVTVPHPTTVMRLLGRLDGDALDAAVSAFLQTSIEIRRIKAAVFRHLDYPGACQALQVVRWRKDLTRKKISIQRLYFVTSLPAGAASGAELAGRIRGHWKIEHQLHHVRDTTFTEAPQRSAAAACPAPWPPCATSRSACSARTAEPTSQPPAVIPPETHSDP